MTRFKRNASRRGLPGAGWIGMVSIAAIALGTGACRDTPSSPPFVEAGRETTHLEATDPDFQARRDSIELEYCVPCDGEPWEELGHRREFVARLGH